MKAQLHIETPIEKRIGIPYEGENCEGEAYRFDCPVVIRMCADCRYHTGYVGVYQVRVKSLHVRVA